MAEIKNVVKGRLIAHKRWHPNDHQGIADRERDLRAVMLEENVKRAVDDFPPLTAEQRARIAMLLAG